MTKEQFLQAIKDRGLVLELQERSRLGYQLFHTTLDLRVVGQVLSIAYSWRPEDREGPERTHALRSLLRAVDKLYPERVPAPPCK